MPSSPERVKTVVVFANSSLSLQLQTPRNRTGFANRYSSCSAEVRRKEAGCLFCPLPYQLSFPAARRSHVGVFHFVARDRHRSLLIGPVPIRKRAAFNAKVKGMIRLIDRVGAKVRNGTMYRRLILICCAFKTVITRKFWARLTYNRYGEMAICIEYKHAPRLVSGDAVRRWPRRQLPSRLPRLSAIVRPIAPKTASGSSRLLRKRLH
jgi:hypothetical protein